MLSYDTLVKAIAQAMAYLLEYARSHSSDDGWQKLKKANKEIRNWTTLFDEVYEDDELTEDEEKKIQDAISNCTSTKSIYTLLKKNGKTSKKAKKISKQIEESKQ